MSRDAMLDAIAASPAFTAIDRVLASTFVRHAALDGEQAAAVALALACLSSARQAGHSALSLEELAEQASALTREAPGERNGSVSGLAAPAWPAPAWPAPAWPALPYDDLDWWRAQLAAPAVVSGDPGVAPLVFSDDLLQFRRLREAERRIADRVESLLAVGGDAFRIITGGPGTGKTTLVATTLIELVSQNPALRIALAAPTGKAAARLSESIRLRLDEARADTHVRARVPQSASTLHRLLGYNAATDRFRAAGGSPLAGDLVIVDEASMVDVLLMDALLAALGPGARLMLVGDHNQLASVDAGDVLGAFCRAGERRPAGDPLRESITRLTRSHRFEAHPAIGALASAILAGDAARAMTVLRDPAQEDARWTALSAGPEALLAPLVPHLERCVAASTPRELLSALDAFRVLCPERHGALGVDGITALVEQWLRRRGVPVFVEWYNRRPVLVTANDYGTNVFNGDLGVVWESHGETLVHFPDADGATRAISPARLPESVTAWAMTVHKAQGSEFDDVLVTLPSRGSRVLGRELLYTAVTRARTRVTLFGDDAVITAGVERSSQRTSGLERLLEQAT